MTAHEIIRQVALKYRFLPETLTAHGKHRPLVRARQEAWFRIVMEMQYSMPRAAMLTGTWDHTSVLYGIRQYAQRELSTPPKATLTQIRDAWQALELERAA